MKASRDRDLFFSASGAAGEVDIVNTIGGENVGFAVDDAIGVGFVKFVGKDRHMLAELFNATNLRQFKRLTDLSILMVAYQRFKKLCLGLRRRSGTPN